jgi:pilus assembly protein CpaE
MEHAVKAILVGCGPDEAPQVHEALNECAVVIEAEFPDARSAIDNVRLSPNEQRLCIMSVPGPEQVQALKWLSESFVGRPVLALVGRDSPPDMLFAVNRAGASQILGLPLEVPDLKAALHAVKVRHSSPQSVAARRVIAVSGVTGGCGATTIAINLAYEISHLFELSCVLVELAPMGMIATCLDVDARHTTSDLLCDMQSVDVGLVEKTLSKITDRFSILPAPFREAEPLNTNPADVVRLLEHVKQLADVVILDLPANNYDRHLETFSATDQVVLVAEQAVPSLRALTYVRERLSEDEGFRRQTLVINRYSANKEGFNVTHLQRLLRTPQLVTIASDYQAVSASHNEGRPLRMQSPGSRVLADIDRLAGMLVSTGPESAPPAVRPTRKRLGQVVRSMFGL